MLYSLLIQVPDDRLATFTRRVASTEDITVPRAWLAYVTEPGLGNLDRDHLVTMLDDIRERVASGDSLEGFFSYLLASVDAPEAYDVEARYRVGNRAGQGGMRMFGHRVLWNAPA